MFNEMVKSGYKGFERMLHVPGRSKLSLLDKLTCNRLNEKEKDVLAEAVRQSDQARVGDQTNQTVEPRALEMIEIRSVSKRKDLNIEPY